MCVKSIFVFSCILWSCGPEERVVEGMMPIYSDFDDFTSIVSKNAQAFGKLGQIVSSGDYLYINEVGQGIHVIDNLDPSSPQNIYFWQIYGNTEFTIKDEVLYANNGKHVLVIDVADPSNIQFLTAIKNQFIVQPLEIYPDNYKGWFECFRPEKGNLIAWQLKKIINPTCEIK